MSRYMIEKVGKNDYNLYRINDDERSDNFLTLELLFPEKIFIEKNNRTFHFSKGDIMKRWNWGRWET